MKGEISWKKRTSDGMRLQVYAHRAGGSWRFFVRERRYERWQPMEKPELEDWRELLDGVRRRVSRRLLPPEEEARLCKIISEQYPEADIG